MSPRQMFIEDISRDNGIDSDTMTELVGSLDSIPEVSSVFDGESICFSVISSRGDICIARLLAEEMRLYLPHETSIPLLDIDDSMDDIILHLYRLAHDLR